MKSLQFGNCAGWGSGDYRADKLERQPGRKTMRNAANLATIEGQADIARTSTIGSF